MWDKDDFVRPSSITFTYRSYDDKGTPTAFIERSLHGENTDYLPNILREFMYFLHGLTFTYVNEVVAQSDVTEHSSNEDVEAL
jgi:hypothetical protein